MWLLKRLLVLVVSVASFLATAEISSENSESATVSDLLPDDNLDQATGASATESTESEDVREPSESILIDLDEPDAEQSLDELLPVMGSPPDHVQDMVTESLTEHENSQGEEIVSPADKEIVPDDDVTAPRENDDGSSVQEDVPQEKDIDTATLEENLNTGHINGDDEMIVTEVGEGDSDSETTAGDSELVDEASVIIETTDTLNADNVDHTSELSDRAPETIPNLQDEEASLSVDHLSAEPGLREDSERVQPVQEDASRIEETASPGDQEIQASDKSKNGSSVSTDKKSEISEARYQPNCGVWGLYQTESRYANISILALLFQDLFQKDEDEAAAILKDLASSVTIPMQDVLDRIQNVTEEIREMADSPDRIKRSPNSEFVEGLDDIDKFFEGVDVPDELDVGAVGSSIQEVLMGQGTQIVIKRLKMGLIAIQECIIAIQVSVVTNIEDIVSRREELAAKNDEFLRALKNGKAALAESIVDFRDGGNDRRKELLQQLARFSWRTALKTANAFKDFVERLLEDEEDIQDILKESTGVDDEIQQMLRKVS